MAEETLPHHQHKRKYNVSPVGRQLAAIVIPFPAYLHMAFRASITSMDNMGDKGSPCQRPLRWEINSPGSPLITILVEEVDNRRQIRLHQVRPKPKCCNSSSKKDQDTESKALEMSNFKRMWSPFLRCKSLASCWTKSCHECSFP